MFLILCLLTCINTQETNAPAFQPHFENTFTYDDSYYENHPYISRVYWNANFNKLLKDVHPKYLQFQDGNIKDYSKFDLIGKGAFSQVYLGSNKVNNELVILKELKPIKPIAINREIQILQALNGTKNIVQLVDAVRSQSKKQNATLIYKYIASHNLHSLSLQLNLEQIKFYMFQLLQALDGTHSHGVMHRDVKLANIIVNEDSLTLIDWGLSDFYHPKKRYNTKVGTRYYKAPELLVNYQYYDYGIDMWAFGCTFASLVFKRNPLIKSKENYEQLEKIVRVLGTEDLVAYIEKYDIDFHSIPQHTKKSWRLFINEENKYLATDEAIDLIEKLLVYDHKLRLTAKEAMSHQFFDNLNKGE